MGYNKFIHVYLFNGVHIPLMDFSLFNLKFSENLFKYIPGTTLSSCLGINCIDPLLRAVLQKGLCDLPAHKFKMNTPYLNLFLCTLTFFFLIYCIMEVILLL